MPKAIPGDEALVRAMQAGDEAALGAVIDQYTAYAGTIVWNIVGGVLPEADGAEILADVFYILWKNRANIRSGKLKAFLGSIARSRALDALRRAKQDVSLEDNLIAVTTAGPEDDLSRAEEYRALARAVDSLPEPDRTIFLRHYYSYQSTSAIARQLGMNVNTVQTKLRRGREVLRRALEEGGYCRG